MKRVVALSIAAMILLAHCSRGEIASLEETNKKLKERVSHLESDVRAHQGSAERLSFLSDKLEGIKARIETNVGDIELKLYPELAPIHCFNFVTRAESGFYDNTQFHRVIPGFMIQGGDPNTRDKDPYNDGQGGPIASIPHEFNRTAHKRGILSMARVGDISAGAGSQFFLMHGDSPHLDNQYTAFGEVVNGMNVVDKIATTPTNEKDPRLRNRPLEPMIIKTIDVYR